MTAQLITEDHRELMRDIYALCANSGLDHRAMNGLLIALVVDRLKYHYPEASANWIVEQVRESATIAATVIVGSTVQ